jgi:hypothetical protein
MHLSLKLCEPIINPLEAFPHFETFPHFAIEGLALDGNNLIGALMFSMESAERVVLLLYVYKHRVRTDILTVTNDQSLKEIVDAFCRVQKFSDIFRGSDPIPKPVGSGNLAWLYLDIEEGHGREK